MEDEPFEIYGISLGSRLLLGTAGYPSLDHLEQSVMVSGTEVVTVSLRRETGLGLGSGQEFWEMVRALGVKVLPNTAGCRSVKEVMTTAHMAREIFETPWIKLEIVGEEDILHPDVFGLVEAAGLLTREGFQVFPYTTEDLVVADRLLECGCQCLMPWGAPIGSARGLNNPFGLEVLRAQFPDIPMIIDAGLGLPSHASASLEMGFDAVLVNTAVARAGDSVSMARAFGLAVEAGRLGWRSDPMAPSSMAILSTPAFGKAALG